MASDKTGFGGKVALVTGGASGIGRALGEELSQRGAEVVLADRQIELAEEAARGIRERGGAARAAELDVRSLPAWEALAAETRSRSGHIDYLFNNAGIGVGFEMANGDPEDWDDVIDVNLRGVAWGIQAVYPDMARRGSGHIVNTASIAGLLPSAGEGSYAATKHAVVGVTKALRVEGERYGVRASVLCPGAIRTPILTGGRYGRLKIGNVATDDIMRIWERMRPIPPDELSRKTLDAVQRNEAFIVIPGWWKAFWYLERLSPSLSLRLWTAVFERVRAELIAKGATFEKPRADGPAAPPAEA
jgi:NAD(P)-dependent dehydrogenase (short-subunit alcohol dehydrogenase family)